MKAFFSGEYTEHQIAAHAHKTVAVLGELEPGSYVVTAKAALTTPGVPATPYDRVVSAWVGLALDNAVDSARAPMVAASDHNHANVSLMVAATITKASSASLSAGSSSGAPITVSSIKIAAFQVDELEFVAQPRKKPDWAADLAPRFEESGLIQATWQPTGPGGGG